GLTERIEEPCSIEFLDMRSHVGRLVYQHGLIMIYLKAVEETMGRQKVEVMAALSKGLYTEINDGEEIPDEALDAIRQRMNEIVEKDMQFFKVTADRKAAKMEFEWAGLNEKLRIIEQFKDVEKIVYYSLEGFINFFYGVMVPSTSYITGFEVKRYRRGILLALPEKREGSGLQYIDDRKLYSAFMQTKKWQKVLGTQFVLDLNNKIRKGEAKEIIQLSEALHEQNIIELAQRIIKEKKRIILISGPSSSGKTTFARRLCIQLKVNGKKPLYLGTDDYFKNREDTPLNEKGEKDYECLEAVEVEMFNRDMNALLAGQKVDLPEFDFIEGVKKYGKRITSIEHGDPIVIEGIHALNKKMTPAIDDKEKFKIYISPLTQLNIDDHNRISVTDARMLRRIVRDYQFRDHTAASTIKSWPSVRAGENKNVFPFNGEADVFINTMHVYEIGVLKKYAAPLLKEITPDQEEYAEARRLLAFLRFFETIEDDHLIVNNSILREFIGGSVFVD
ncbi:MAG: hypothetical protein UHP11_04185, partial [Anaerovoracaceae bacterium]|nr:hypothetical protein [Anaerovoracaceae bacterium]